MKHEIIESFRWLPPGDLRVKKGAGKKVIIRGRALFAGGVSRNLRKYVKEELVRAARTLVGKPVTINHNSSRIVGHVIDAEEEENAIEYVAEINKGDYPQKLLDRKAMTADSYYKKWMVNPVSGVSVEADYRHNRCVKCGSQFYDQETFMTHMWESHKLKNFKFEPRGILMKALSLVEPPEKPGVPGTTIELMEKAEGASRLMETLATDIKKEIEWKIKMKSATVSTPKSIAIGKGRKLKEQEEKDEHGCVVGKEQWDGTKCVAVTTEQEDHGCAEDEEWDGEKCVKKVAEQDQTVQDQPEPLETKPPLPCADGFTYDPISGTCIADEHEADLTADTPAPLMVPEPTIEPAKVVDPTLVAPAQAAGPVIEQEDGVLPSAPFPTAPPEAPAEVTQECPEGSSWDKVSGTCVPDPIPDVTSDFVVEQTEPVQAGISTPADISRECEVGSHYDPVSGTCVPDKIPAETGKVLESLPTLLRFGEFGGTQYTSMDDCKSKNQDKDNPNAYCADIMRKSHGETLMETSGNIYEATKKADDAGYIRDVKLASATNQQIKALAQINREASKGKIALHRLSIHDTKQRRSLVRKLSHAANKQSLTESKLRAAEDTWIKAKVNDTARKLSRTDMKIAKDLSTVTEQLNKNDKAIIAHINTLFERKVKADNKKFSQLATGLAKNLAETRGNKSDYERILEATDKVSMGKIRTLEQRVKEQDEELEKKSCGENEHWSPEEGKCVPNTPKEEAEETKKLKETVEELTVKVENLEAGRKGKFKGQSKQAKKPEPAHKDPYTGKKK